MKYSYLTLAFAATTEAYPFVTRMPGVDSSLFSTPRNKRQQSNPNQAGGSASCPYNDPANHVPAVALNPLYPYNNASYPTPGNGRGGYLVPAPGDTDHQFIAPDYTKDIRGPCPGLNAAANHGFLARDGITTFGELVDAQQNLYNVGYDLAVLLAVLGLSTTDGDLVTQKLSIGCDATTRTSYNPTLTGSEPGLDGHNKFEADTSLTRNDYFTHAGNNYEFNGTLFANMLATVDTVNGVFDRDGLALYRAQRYNQSLAENPDFYFGPFSLLLFGASSFLYELMPSGPDYVPDLATISSFFGAAQQSDGSWAFNGQERIPPNWTNRVAPYTIPLVAKEIGAQYQEYPVLFGGATGNGGFDALSTGSYTPYAIQGGTLVTPDVSSVACLLYQVATERLPSTLNAVVTPVVEGVNTLLGVLNPQFKNFGCQLVLT